MKKKTNILNCYIFKTIVEKKSFLTDQNEVLSKHCEYKTQVIS